MKCRECWYEPCRCENIADDVALAQSMVVVANNWGGIVPPRDDEQAKQWVRLCAIRDGKDPNHYRLDPLGKPYREAVRVLRDAEATA